MVDFNSECILYCWITSSSHYWRQDLLCWKGLYPNNIWKIISSFSSLDCEFLLGNRLIDIFPNIFSFYSLNRKNKNNIKSHLHSLKSVSLQLSSDPHTTIVISDASIKNSIATSIAYVHIYNSLVIKTIYHAVNITSTETEIFAL